MSYLSTQARVTALEPYKAPNSTNLTQNHGRRRQFTRESQPHLAPAIPALLDVGCLVLIKKRRGRRRKMRLACDSWLVARGRHSHRITLVEFSPICNL